MEMIFPKNTIILADFLKEAKESSRRRFTLAHEIGHLLLERLYLKNGCTEILTSNDKAVKNRLECQANTIASGLLMPKWLVHKTMVEVFGDEQVVVFGDNVLEPTVRFKLYTVASLIGVSFTALKIRLRELGYFKSGNLFNYLSEVLELGGLKIAKHVS